MSTMERLEIMHCQTCLNPFSFFTKNNFLHRVILLLIIVAAAVCPAAAQTCTGIPNGECQALYALYNNTGGASWTDNTNWLSAEPVGDWYGIKVDGGHVTELRVGNNSLTGTIPPELGNLANLEQLSLQGNSLSGGIPPELGNLTNLVNLNLNSNYYLGGEIPPELGNLTELRFLFLQSLHLTGEIPAELGNLTHLLSIYLDVNELTGEIPPEFGNLTSLYVLYLSSNSLSGSIPPDLANLTGIEQLYLHNNRLTGEIPPELGNMTDLEILFLHSNNLSGEIPPELGDLANLEQLVLFGNSLSGEIPAELGNLSNLERLDLYSNKLSGGLPSFLAAPPDTLNLSWNCLYTDNSAILAAMEDKHSGEFISTQTLPPVNVTAEVVQSDGTEENRVQVSWDPISYIADEGGYRVFYKQTPPPTEEPPSPAEAGSDYHYAGMIYDKGDTSFIVSNLEPGTDYTFRVNTVTWSHQNNQNDLHSPGSGTDSVVSGTLSRAFIPAWKQESGYFTGVVVSNFGDSAFNLTLSAFDPAGVLEPLGQNPAATSINAGFQKSLLGWEFFQGDPYHEDLSWIELGAENSNKMGSIFLYGVSDTQMLDGAESQSSYAKKLYFTRPLNEGFFDGWQPDIQMCLVNPTDEEVTLTCTLQGSNGYSTRFHTIPSRGFISGDYGDLVYPNQGILNAFLEIEVTEGPGIVGFSRIEFPGVRTALGMNAAEYSVAQTMYSAQLAHGLNIVTNLRLVNTSDEYRRITLAAIGDDGKPLAAPVLTGISSRSIFSADLGTLFELEGEGVVTTGSLVVVSDGRGVIGDIIFAEGDTLEYAMSLPLQTDLFQEAVFNHIANLPTVFTGFAFFNPGDETATVLIEAIGTNGTKVAEKTVILGPGERIARTLNDPDIWPEFPAQSGGYIKIQSDQPIAGQQLFGDRSLRYMAAIPPTTRLEAMFD